MKIQDYIIQLLDEGQDVSKVKITNFYSFGSYKFTFIYSDQTIKTIYVEKTSFEDESLVEFYNPSNELIARAKGFTSVI